MSILTFVFFDDGVQKFSWLHNFFFCLRSQLENVVKHNDYIDIKSKITTNQPWEQGNLLIGTFIL